ncbi:MAG: hypothetical protein NPMRth3_1440002 [Nitrosopumilales archaeon]|nr:MAG: hypothetical protein NPMRth3_1440002 [Nitrosopumilales archaeon]
MKSQFFVEISDFESFARFVCALRENPLRVYSHDFKGEKVFSSRIVLSNSLLSFYTKAPKLGRYISYSVKGGREECVVANSTKAISKYAPIIHLSSIPKIFVIDPKKISDKFKTIQVEDLGSLARLTYDPEFPEEQDLTLYSFPHKKKWIIGYITELDLEETVHCFNYMSLENEPTKPFLQYSLSEQKTPVFTDKFQHGYSYLPVIKLKSSHPIFGLV